MNDQPEIPSTASAKRFLGGLRFFLTLGAVSGVVACLGEGGEGVWVAFALLAIGCIASLQPGSDLGRTILGMTIAFATSVLMIIFWVFTPRSTASMAVPELVFRGALLWGGLLYCALFLIVGTAFGLKQQFWPPLPPAEPRCKACGYLLIGLPEPRCPECGTPFERTGQDSEPGA